MKIISVEFLQEGTNYCFLINNEAMEGVTLQSVKPWKVLHCGLLSHGRWYTAASYTMEGVTLQSVKLWKVLHCSLLSRGRCYTEVY